MSLTPATGFDPNFTPSQLLINGAQATADVTDATSDASLERTVTGASTLTIAVQDSARTFIRSATAQILTPQIPTLNLDGTYSPSSIPYVPTTCAIIDGTNELAFALAAVQKQADQVTLTFEDLIVNQLRYVFATEPGFMSTAGTVTRVAFMLAIINRAGINADIVAVPDSFNGVSPVQEQLQWGTTDDPTEDAWTCLTRLANEVQWRCFCTGNAIVIGPDAWLLSLGSSWSPVENTGGVDSIDFDWDMGQAEATATVNCQAQLLGFVPGQVVTLTNLGVANGLWIVSDMTRDLYTPDAVVSLCQPQPSISEAQAAALTNGTGAATTTTTPPTSGLAGTGGSNGAQLAVAYALQQQGKPYVTGGTGPGGFDCSGLVWAAYVYGASQPRTFPRTSEAQHQAACPQIDLMNLLPGDLVFYNDGFYADPGHVVMYIGNGKCVQAEQTGTNVQVTTLPGGSPYMAARPVPVPS